eukprot:3106949-Pleurochrysis_carterae.AAC.2
MLARVSAQERLKVRRVKISRVTLRGCARVRVRCRSGEGGDGHEEHGAKRGGAQIVPGEPGAEGCPAAGGSGDPRAAGGFTLRAGWVVRQSSLRVWSAHAGTRQVATGTQKTDQVPRRTRVERARDRIRERDGKKSQVEHDGGERYVVPACERTEGFATARSVDSRRERLDRCSRRRRLRGGRCVWRFGEEGVIGAGRRDRTVECIDSVDVAQKIGLDATLQLGGLAGVTGGTYAVVCAPLVDVEEPSVACYAEHVFRPLFEIECVVGRCALVGFVAEVPARQGVLHGGWCFGGGESVTRTVPRP